MIALDPKVERDRQLAYIEAELRAIGRPTDETKDRARMLRERQARLQRSRPALRAPLPAP